MTRALCRPWIAGRGADGAPTLQRYAAAGLGGRSPEILAPGDVLVVRIRPQGEPHWTIDLRAPLREF